MKWSVTNLEALSVFGPQYGANARAVPASGTRPRYVRITDIDSDGRLVPGSNVEADIEDGSEFLLQEGDLLFARSGNTVGKTYRYASKDGPCIFAGYLIRFKINPNLADSQFVFYFTQSPTYQSWVISKRRVAGQPNINGKEYESLRLPLPPISEQRRIVEILQQADDLRKKRAEADAKAARLQPALFYNIFGDPITNPKGFNKKKLGELIRVRSGNFLPAKDMAPDGQYPVYGGNGINGYHSKFMFEEPVIVLGRVGIYCGAVHYSEPKCWVTDNALYVEEHSEDLHARYLAEALRMANLNQYAGRAGQPLISGSRIYPVEILVPNFKLQEKFAFMVEEFQQYERQRKSACDELEKLFSVLLHRAFTGDLTHKWREAHMKELMVEMELQAKAIGSPWVASSPPTDQIQTS